MDLNDEQGLSGQDSLNGEIIGGGAWKASRLANSDNLGDDFFTVDWGSFNGDSNGGGGWKD